MIDNLVFVMLVGTVLIAVGGAVCGYLPRRKRNFNKEQPARRRLRPAVGRIDCNGKATNDDLGPPVDSPPPPPLPPRHQQPGGIFPPQRTNQNNSVNSNTVETSHSGHHKSTTYRSATFKIEEETKENQSQPKRPSIFKDIDMKNYLAPGYSKVNKPKK